jgi:DNA-binding SARP family transcriptional activator
VRSARDLNPGSSWPEVAEWPVMIRLLGAFAVLTNGLTLPVRPGGRTESLLSILALRCRRRVSRDALLADVWPDVEPALSGQALNSLLHSLRKLLGPTLEGASPVICVQGSYQLNLEAGIGVDFDRFDELADVGDRQARSNMQEAVASYGRAMTLYGGDLQTGDDQLAVVERERLRARHLTLLARSAAYYYEDLNVEACLQLATRLLEHDPCREDAHRLVMRCHVQRGERAQALRQYRLCADILREEFDAAPEPATVELYDRVRLQPNTV